MDRRELLRKGGAATLLAAVAGVLTASTEVAATTQAIEAAAPKAKAGLTKKLLIQNKALERELEALRAAYLKVRQGFGDLEALFAGRDWREIQPDNLRGMLDLLMPWARQDAYAVEEMRRYVRHADQGQPRKSETRLSRYQRKGYYEPDPDTLIPETDE